MNKYFAIGLATLTVGAIIAVVVNQILIKNNNADVPAGVSQGTPDIFEVPADVQFFFDECHGKGGVITGTGGVKEGLPTTEEGYTCWYQNRECWDFLTYSKERYMGGNPKCPTANLISPNTGAVGAPVQTKPKQTGGAPQKTVISPSANEIAGHWEGSGQIKFSGSQICNNYTLDWSADIRKIREDYLSGEFFDSNDELIGTLQISWDENLNSWTADISSDVLTVTNGIMNQSQVQGNIQIKNAWLPCEDIKSQSGSFHGSKK